jgi:hypothetical protein
MRPVLLQADLIEIHTLIHVDHRSARTTHPGSS